MATKRTHYDFENKVRSIRKVYDESISAPSRNEVYKAIEILNRLTLFIIDLALDPLLPKVSNKINQIRLDRINNLLLVILKKKTVTTVF